MIVVDPFTDVPPFEQVRSQIADQIASAELRAGDRLPTVRQLALDLGLAANTVARAYRELEQAGVIETRGRAGSFVTGDRVVGESKAAAAEYVARIRALGNDDATAVELVRVALRRS